MSQSTMDDEQTLFDSEDDDLESTTTATASVFSESEDEEEVPILKTFIREAIDSLTDDEKEKGYGNQVKLVKMIRKKLPDILEEHFVIKDRWGEDAELAQITRKVRQFMKKERTEEYGPALRKAVRNRKDLIDAMITEIVEETEDDEENVKSLLS